MRHLFSHEINCRSLSPSDVRVSKVSKNGSDYGFLGKWSYYLDPGVYMSFEKPLLIHQIIMQPKCLLNVLWTAVIYEFVSSMQEK